MLLWVRWFCFLHARMQLVTFIKLYKSEQENGKLFLYANLEKLYFFCCLFLHAEKLLSLCFERKSRKWSKIERNRIQFSARKCIVLFDRILINRKNQESLWHSLPICIGKSDLKIAKKWNFMKIRRKKY